jgi:hypothetical protein
VTRASIATHLVALVLGFALGSCVAGQSVTVKGWGFELVVERKLAGSPSEMPTEDPPEAAESVEVKRVAAGLP